MKPKFKVRQDGEEKFVVINESGREVAVYPTRLEAYEHIRGEMYDEKSNLGKTAESLRDALKSKKKKPEDKPKKPEGEKSDGIFASMLKSILGDPIRRQEMKRKVSK